MPRKILFIVLLLWGSRCSATDIDIQPLGAQLSSQQPVASIVLTNRGNEPMLIQTQAYAWTQQNGEDIYSKTQDLLITPPIVSIPPGQQQLLRVGWLKPFPTQREQAYRLYIQQVPMTVSLDNSGKNSIMILLRLGLPVFVEPLVAQASQLRWRIQAGKNHQKILSVDNTGNAHAKIIRIDLAQNGHPLPGIDTFKYILPDQSQSWAVTASGKSSGPWQVIATTDLGIQPPVAANLGSLKK